MHCHPAAVATFRVADDNVLFRLGWGGCYLHYHYLHYHYLHYHYLHYHLFERCACCENLLVGLGLGVDRLLVAANPVAGDPVVVDREV